MKIVQRELKKTAIRLHSHAAELSRESSLVFTKSGLLMIFLDKPFEFCIAGSFIICNMKNRFNLLKTIEVWDTKRNSGNYFKISKVDEQSMILLSFNTGDQCIYKLSDSFDIRKLTRLDAGKDLSKAFKIEKSPFIAGVQLIAETLSFWFSNSGELAKSFPLSGPPFHTEYISAWDTVVIDTKSAISVYEMTFTDREDINTLTFVQKYAIKKAEDSMLNGVSLHEEFLLLGLSNNVIYFIISVNQKGQIVNSQTFAGSEQVSLKQTFLFDEKNKVAVICEKSKAMFHELTPLISEKNGFSKSLFYSEIPLDSRILLQDGAGNLFNLYNHLKGHFLYLGIAQILLK